MPSDTNKYLVRQGDCLSSIASRLGLPASVIWNDGANADLKQKRKNHINLLPGDELFIPDIRRRHETIATEARHRFRRYGIPLYLRLRILKPNMEKKAQSTASSTGAYGYEDPDFDDAIPEPGPEADAPFRLTVEGEMIEGVTDKDGLLEQSIPPNATTAVLVLHPGTEDEREFDLKLGEMDPIEETIGIAKRLRNLAIPCPLVKDASPEFKAALKLFQVQQGLTPSGEPDQSTLNKLKTLHGC